jgi:hypothetical protein
MSYSESITRRAVLSGVAAAATIGPALAQNCTIGPPPHTKGPLVFMNYDQVELDAAYEQVRYDPLLERTAERLVSNSDAVHKRISRTSGLWTYRRRKTRYLSNRPSKGANRVQRGSLRCRFQYHSSTGNCPRDVAFCILI